MILNFIFRPQRDFNLLRFLILPIYRPYRTKEICAMILLIKNLNVQVSDTRDDAINAKAHPKKKIKKLSRFINAPIYGFV